MKRIALILVFCLFFSPACLAESTHADDFIAGLTQAWDGLVGMATDAGNAVSSWADENGVTQWMEGAAQDITAWANDSGLTEWAQGAQKDIESWADDAGLTELAEEARKFIDENGPAVEAWLAQAGEDVRQAWDTLVYADQHTNEEVREACETVVESLETPGE